MGWLHPPHAKSEGAPFFCKAIDRGMWLEIAGSDKMVWLAPGYNALPWVAHLLPFPKDGETKTSQGIVGRRQQAGGDGLSRTWFSWKEKERLEDVPLLGKKNKYARARSQRLKCLWRSDVDA